MAGLPTGRVTFLFTDVEGSTALLQHLGDQRYARVLADHHEILRAAFEAGGGHEVFTQGDSFLIAFGSAHDAVAAAVAAQREINAHSWPEGAPIRVRMGLHTGEPTVAGNRYVGIDVHRAARIMGVGYGGQVLLSYPTRDLIKHNLPDGLTVRDLGEHRLKDLAGPEHIFQIVDPDLPADFPPLKTLNNISNNLPIQLTTFIGREREVEEVKRSLAGTRLLTLMGAAGSGKTRLAVQVAADVIEHFEKGVWLVDLAPLADTALVVQAVAATLQVRQAAGRSLVELIVDHLHSKSLLLVLDNCEHVVAACAQLAGALLRVSPNLKILATSREALGVAGETTWRVPPLSIPDPRHLPPLDRFMEYEAVRLFIDRAVAIDPQLAVTSSSAPTVAQICHRLDGLPLAIELAAAQVKVLTVEQIADRLDDRFRLLAGGSPSTPRHQTLRAAMDWSYELLSDEERTVFRRVSVFAGGWTLDAAEAVCSGSGVEAADMLDLLTQLVDKSMATAETRDGEPRYVLLETVRQYGRDRLLESNEGDGLRDRHRDWFLALAERAEPALCGPQERIWFDRLETEHDNFRAAYEWTMTDGGGRREGLRFATALYHFWLSRGYWSEGYGWLEDGLKYGHDVAPSTRAKALAAAAVLAWRTGKDERAIALAEEGLASCKEVGDRENGAQCLVCLSNLASDGGDYERATRFAEESLSLCSGLENLFPAVLTLSDLGELARFRGEYDQAIALHERSLTMARKSIPYLVANISRNLGMDHLRRGDYGHAAQHYAESLRVCGGSGNRWVPVECLRGLGDLACVEEQFERAARLLGAANQLHETLGLRSKPSDQECHDRYTASARARLGESAFAKAWAEGRAMTLEQAVEYALAKQTG